PHLPHLHSFPTRRSSDLLPGGLYCRLFPDPDGLCRENLFPDGLCFRLLPDGYCRALSPGQIRILLSFPYPFLFFLTPAVRPVSGDRKSTRLNSSHVSISY